MKSVISILIVISFGLSCAARGDNYEALAAKGYRWLAVHGPYAGITEQVVERTSDRRSGPTEAQISL